MSKNSDFSNVLSDSELLSESDQVALVFDASNHYLVAGIFGCGLALERVSHAPREAFQRLHGVLEELLIILKEKTGKEKPDWIGTTLGPGSFTGLRISVGTARNLAQLWKLPVLGTDVLSYTAREFLEGIPQKRHPKNLAVFLDGRQRRVYWREYAMQSFLENPAFFLEPAAIQDESPKRSLEQISSDAVLLVDDPKRVASYLGPDASKEMQARLEGCLSWPEPTARALYKHLLLLGGMDAAGHWKDLLPVYARSDPATSAHPAGFRHT